MHSWHPVAVHFPLASLLLAAAFDFAAVVIRGGTWRTRCRDSATVLWAVGLVGGVAALVTGLLAYRRVEHSDPAHLLMTQHRNLAFLSLALLTVAAVWRWKRPFSRLATGLGLVGAISLGGVGLLGGEMVYRHALGVPTETLHVVVHERGDEHHHEEEQPAVTRPPTGADSGRQAHQHDNGSFH